MLSILFAAQLAAAVVAVDSTDSTYSTPALRELVARAAAANRVPPPEFRSYSSRIETEISMLLRDTLGREHTSQVEQLATRGAWSRNGRYDLHVIGYRSQTIGVPYSALSMIRAWTIPSLYGDRLLLGVYFNQSSRRRDTLLAVHPLAADRDRYYRFSGGDTVTVLRVHERLIPIARIHVRPNYAAARKGKWIDAFEGEIDLDADRAQIVRMRGRFVSVYGHESGASRVSARALQAATGAVAVAYAEFVNAEVDGKFWLPVFQRTEFQAGLALLGQTRPVFRIVSRISDVAVTENAPGEPVDSASPLRVRITWAPQDSVSDFHDWARTLGEQSGSVHSDDFIDIAPDVWRPTGAPRIKLFPNNTSRIIRFNRVEGLFTGVAPTVDFRSLVPGLSLGGHVGWAWSEETARGGAFASYARGGTTYGVRAERALASTNDFTLPLEGDFGIIALLGAVDNRDYVDRRTAMVSLTRVLHSINVGLMTVQAGLGEDRPETQRIEHGMITTRSFRQNRGAASGSYAIGAADLELNPNVTGDYVQPGVGLRAHYEAASGDLRWQRAELSVSARQYFGPVSVAAHADGGIVVGGVIPPQQLFELGGDLTLPGYRYKEFVGDRAALFRTFASYRFNIWRRPTRAWRWMIPGVSPGVAVSAQGGWSELSSAAARSSSLALGLTDDGQPVSTPTNGVRATVGGGVTFFGDLLHIGVARPVDRPSGWRFVIGYGPAF